MGADLAESSPSDDDVIASGGSETTVREEDDFDTILQLDIDIDLFDEGGGHRLLAFRAGGLDERLGDVQGDDASTGGAEQSGVVAFPAAEIETDQR